MGGGSLVAENLTRVLGSDVPLLGKIPFDVRLREGGDNGEPFVISFPDEPAAIALREIAAALTSKPRGLAGVSLNISPAGR
jgi:ATP-binding protein involved in chromosome partitioning